MRVGIFIRFLSVLVVVAVFLIWGLPYVIQMGPAVCERWKMTTGICSPSMQERIRALDEWTGRWLRPFSKQERVQSSFERARQGLSTLEAGARHGLGDETVEAALRGVDVAVNEAGKILGDSTQRKVQDIPTNAQKLLTELRTALDRLRGVLSGTQKRAEDITDAVDDTRSALDALSSALPKQD